MNLVYLMTAALCFAAGGLFMKASSGATRLPPTAAFLFLFIIGALLQARAMLRADMSVVYTAVLGLEAVAAVLFSVALLHEAFSWRRGFAVAIIVAGVMMLRRL
jgi:multidrug transporter EmrE-like cation transporter